jgi:hypothetical protein
VLTFVFRLFSLFCAGVFLQMSLVHLLRPEETKGHYLIRRARSPRKASAAWGLFQLASALAIAMAFGFRLAFNWESLAAFLGFALWGMFLAGLAAKKMGEPAIPNSGFGT